MIKLNLIIYLYFFIYLINIINFTDGADGFLTLNSITFFLGILLFEYFETNFEFLFVISLIILPILLVFMIYNKPKAKIFMGDSGSIFLAYLIGFCSIELISLGKWYLVISLLSYTFLDCTITLIKKTINGYAPWARLFDYYFLKPIRINKKNNFLVFRYNLIYNILNLTVVFFQIYYGLNYLFILSIIFSLILMNKYESFEKIKS
jgi:UDP-N-acetylmuramyl pentapeptide phosphotransferase/UDP-N-acetylglucosamine-1-phosphate transferase